MIRPPLLAATMILSLGTVPAVAQSTMNVTIQIDGAAVPYYLPLFVADRYGYFEEAGLEVQFLYANAADILTNVAVGNVQFGFPNGDAIIAARWNGLPVKVVHTTYQSGIGAVLSKTSSGIKEPADLEGKRVAVTSYGSPNYVQLQVMMAQANLSVEDVTVGIVGTGSIIEALVSNQVDAIVFSMLRYYALQAQGIAVSMIRADDYLPSKGNVLVTSEDFLESNPKQIAGFIVALNRGIEHVVGGDVRAEVDMAVANYTPTFAGQEELVTQIIEEVFVPTLWQSDDTKTHELGYGNLESWQRTIDTAAEYEVIGEEFEASDMVVERPSSIQ